MLASKRERKEELELGKEMDRADIMTAENDKQIRAYKKEQFKKEMREAW